jgi:hypothetical protein
MTPYQKRFVDSILSLGKTDPVYANWAILDFQKLDPYQLGKLKELVLLEARRLKSEAPTLAKLD